MIGASIDSIGQFWPYVFLCIKVMIGGALLTPIGAAVAARHMRRKAYGPGGGRK